MELVFKLLLVKLGKRQVNTVFRIYFHTWKNMCLGAFRTSLVPTDPAARNPAAAANQANSDGCRHDI